MSTFICGYQVGASLCIHDDWHDGAHVMVARTELGPGAEHTAEFVEAA